MHELSGVQVSLTRTESDTAIMFAAKDDALEAAKKATQMLCKDAAFQEARYHPLSLTLTLMEYSFAGAASLNVL